MSIKSRHRSAARLRLCLNRKASSGPLAVCGSVEAVGKPQSFEFLRQEDFCFQGLIFSKKTSLHPR